ncbi:MAG: TonB family protein [Gammaproteobacteria bacterium]|nr:TonB family protein [Gammaproteobacteria bacterium]
MNEPILIPRTGIAGFLLRFGISLAVATVFVVGVLAIGIAFYGEEEKDPGALPDLAEVKMISVKDNPDLQRMIREARGEPVDPLRELPEPPPTQPERQVQGFVQLEYTINPDGTVSDVKVVGAAPSGVFEERAVQRLQQSMRAPIYEDGKPVTRRTTEILEFSVPASELQSRGPDSN